MCHVYIDLLRHFSLKKQVPRSCQHATFLEIFLDRTTEIKKMFHFELRTSGVQQMVELIEVTEVACEFIEVADSGKVKMISFEARQAKAYLPGVGDTLIRKGVLPWRGLSIALRAG